MKHECNLTFWFVILLFRFLSFQTNSLSGNLEKKTTKNHSFGYKACRPLICRLPDWLMYVGMRLFPSCSMSNPVGIFLPLDWSSFMTLIRWRFNHEIHLRCCSEILWFVADEEHNDATLFEMLDWRLLVLPVASQNWVAFRWNHFTICLHATLCHWAQASGNRKENTGNQTASILCFWKGKKCVGIRVPILGCVCANAAHIGVVATTAMCRAMPLFYPKAVKFALMWSRTILNDCFFLLWVNFKSMTLWFS